MRKQYRRNKRPKELQKQKGGYDSAFEKTLHETILKDWEHHEGTLDYVIEHKYHPDFVKRIGTKKILLEAKGRFWDHAEYSKYIWIKKTLPSNTELVFLFANSTLPMPQTKKRKDGTKRSHGEGATANDFRWFTPETLPDEWRSNSFEEGEENL